MALGETLRLARINKGATVSQVAEATRMMAQIVEELEREDFHRIAAPIYGRGFIKLYAEYVGIDPDPLIDEFLDIYTGKRAPATLVTNLEYTEAEAGDKDDGRSDGSVIKPEATRPDNLSQSDETAASKIPAADVTDHVDLDEGDLFAAAWTTEKREHKEDVPPRVNPVATQAAEFPSRGKPHVAKDSEKQTSKTARSRRTTSPATVIAGLQRLKSGLSLPLIAWFTPRRLLSGGLLVLIAASLIFGVRSLLKIMSANAKSPPNLQSHAVLPPPEPYFD